MRAAVARYMSKELTSPSLDSQLAALGHIDRRRLLLALLDAEEANTLPVEIDGSEHGADGVPLQMSMHHVHLPKLADLGFVDADHGSVTTGPRFDRIRPLLELLETNRERLPDDWR